MTEAMPFLQKTILLSYDPRPFGTGLVFGDSMNKLQGTDLDFIGNQKTSADKLWKYINQ